MTTTLHNIVQNQTTRLFPLTDDQLALLGTAGSILCTQYVPEDSLVTEVMLVASFPLDDAATPTITLNYGTEGTPTRIINNTDVAQAGGTYRHSTVGGYGYVGGATTATEKEVPLHLTVGTAATTVPALGVIILHTTYVRFG